MATPDLENVWIFVGINVIIWIVIASLLGVFFFDGQLIRSVPTSIAGGIASGLTLFFIQNNSEAEGHSQ